MLTDMWPRGLAILTAVSLVTTCAVELSAQKPAPVPAQVRAACDAMYAIASKTPGVSIQRRSGSFKDETLSKPVLGCGIAVSGSFRRAQAAGDASIRLHNDFEARKWQEMGAYSADGTDGTSFAFRNGDVSCFVRGTWDGGAADEPAIPPRDWYKVNAFCTSPPFPEIRR